MPETNANGQSFLLVAATLFLTYSLPKIIELLIKKFGEPRASLDTINIKNTMELYEKQKERNAELEKRNDALEKDLDELEAKYTELDRKYWLLERKSEELERKYKELEQENALLRGEEKYGRNHE